MSSERVSHEFPPVFDERSRVLVLGTIPSPKSREAGFYYMHPRNRFWKMLCAALNEPLPEDADGRRALCLRRGVALWDVLAGCEISGAADSSIKNAQPNDLSLIFRTADIRRVFTTGKKAQALYERFCGSFPPAVCLPSTSPANQTISEEQMLARYMELAQYL